jgi:hypothetical protein
MNFIKKLLGIEVKREPKLVHDIDTAIKLVNELTALGYYKYADPIDVPDLKNDLIDAISKYDILSTIYNDATFIPKDFRYYFCDGEDLFEEGGFLNQLKYIQPVLDKMGAHVILANHHEEWDSQNQGLNHSLTINGKAYIIFKNFKGYGWGEAALRFAEIINDQLALQLKNERIYLINGGNDGAFVFLSNEQYQLVEENLKDQKWRPLTTDIWCSVMKVNKNF